MGTKENVILTIILYFIITRHFLLPEKNYQYFCLGQTTLCRSIQINRIELSLCSDTFVCVLPSYCLGQTTLCLYIYVCISGHYTFLEYPSTSTLKVNLIKITFTHLLPIFYRFFFWVAVCVGYTRRPKKNNR
jgi:hypothetical protein